MSQTKAKLIDAALGSLSDVQGTPTNGQTLTYNSTTGKWEPKPPSGGTSAAIAFALIFG